MPPGLIPYVDDLVSVLRFYLEALPANAHVVLLGSANAQTDGAPDLITYSLRERRSLCISASRYQQML